MEQINHQKQEKAQRKIFKCFGSSKTVAIVLPWTSGCNTIFTFAAGIDATHNSLAVAHNGLWAPVSLQI